jgi:hypothetical protein
MNESYVSSQIESDLNESGERVMPGWASMSLCIFLLLDEHVKGDVYGFRVEDIEVTKVTKKAGITEVAEMAERV